MILSRLIPAILALSLALVGCVKADRNASHLSDKDLGVHSLDRSLIDYNKRALFEVGNIVLTDKQFGHSGDNIDGQFDILRLWFQVCGIRDRASQGTIRYEKFHIESELGSDIFMTENNKVTKVSNPITVNANNCLEWSQTIDRFNYFAPSVNLVLHYKIQSLSGNLGAVVKRISINPWDMHRNNSLSGAFADLTGFNRQDWRLGEAAVGESQVLDAINGRFSQDQHHQARLQMGNVVIVPSPQDREQVETYQKDFEKLSGEEKEQRLRSRQDHLSSKDLKMKINLQGFPQVMVRDATGNEHIEKVYRGRFKINMVVVGTGIDGETSTRYLLAEDMSGKGMEIVNRSQTELEYTASTNGLIAGIPMFLRHDSEYGMVKLGVKVTPLDMPGVEPFEAEFNLGNHDNWMRRQGLNFATNLSLGMDNIDYDSYVDTVKPIDPSVLTAVRKAERFYFRTLNARFVRIIPGETATDRTLQYSVKACVDDGFFGSRAGRGLQFEVITEDLGVQRVMTRQTNEEGCVTWFGLLSHKYYRKEVLVEKIAKVRFIGNLTGRDRYTSMENKYQKEFKYYMNPWDEKWTFGWDEPDMPENYPEKIKEQRKNSPESKLFIADFSYVTQGFRYAIDKHLNLKVKKAVLLKLFPYVLKYNSIIFGRRGTEKLRDGIYLMKVALQKDYLDPAAKGVRIYDCKYTKPLRIANGVEPVELQQENGQIVDLDNMKAYEHFPEFAEIPLEGVSSKPCSGAEVVYDPLKAGSTPIGQGTQLKTEHLLSDQELANSNKQRASVDTLLSEEDLKRSKKRYISVQQKLVRVQGGMIITPVEFEVDDLRLMRIRNQFFVQLQTIDENRLRAAAIIDKSLKSELQNWSLEKAYGEIYNLIGETEQIDGVSASLHDQLHEVIDRLVKYRDLDRAYTEIKRMGVDTSRAENALLDVLGLDANDSRSSQSHDENVKLVRQKILRMLQYKSFGLDAKAAFRNDKAAAINAQMDSILSELRRRGEQQAEQDNEAIDQLLSQQEKEKNRTEIHQDALLKEFMFGRDGRNFQSNILDQIIERRKALAREKGNEELLSILDEIKVADFTQTPLAPNFDFENLLNDGLHQPQIDGQGHEINDDGKSGLPSRTFVGPLTFVFNTNSSSLRPTDSLGEEHCQTAFCEKPGEISPDLQGGGKDENGTEKGNGIPDILEQQFRSTSTLGRSGGTQYDLGRSIYKMGDSINAEYERDKYYGYLGSYAGMTVDHLIKEKREIDLDRERKMRVGSQIYNFTKTLKLKYTLLNDNKNSRLKQISYLGCAENKPLSRLSECYQDIQDTRYVLDRNMFFKQLNERFYPRRQIRELPGVGQNRSGKVRLDFSEVSYRLSDQEISTNDIERIISQDIPTLMSASPVDLEDQLRTRRIFNHRMCFVLAQNFFKEKYFEKKYVEQELRNERLNFQSVRELESMCQRYVNNLYQDRNAGHGFLNEEQRRFSKSNKYLVPQDSMVNFPPIVFERKVRVYETTGRYVYRGGKSININLAASFNLSSSHGIKKSTTATWKPYEWAVSGVAAVGGFFVGGPVGAAAFFGATKAFLGGFGFSRSNGMDESAGRTQGTNVSAGTFLVSQQATVDIELGKYERCMVARFHPVFLKNYFEQSKRLKKNFSHGDDYIREGQAEDNSDIQSFGMMICTGKSENRCLPITEKYYYFTQHFTEGDMLDTADLHNHPWLLQLRGLRDFQTFTASIGARDVNYIDTPNWLSETASRTWSDALALQTGASDRSALQKEFQIVDQNSDMNWPIDELSRSYFGVLPTFPGLYTFIGHEPDWPYENTDPGRSFDRCEAPNN